MGNLLPNGVEETSNSDPASLGGLAVASSIRQEYEVADGSALQALELVPLGSFARLTSDNTRWIYRTEGWRLWDSWGSSYAPTWGSNVTVGNGTTSGFYQFSSGVGTFVVSLTLGSTSAIAGSVSVFLPSNMTLSSPDIARTAIGQGIFVDVSASTSYSAQVRTATNAAVVAEILRSDGTYLSLSGGSSTAPFTWNTGDIITLRFTYPVTAAI